MQEEFSEIMNRLSENARFALQKSDFYSKRYNNGYMGTEHLLLGILAMDNSTGAKKQMLGAHITVVVSLAIIIRFLQSKPCVFAQFVHNFAKFFLHTPIIAN